jgi:hypothetical protein
VLLRHIRAVAASHFVSFSFFYFFLDIYFFLSSFFFFILAAICSSPRCFYTSEGTVCLQDIVH